MTPPDATTSAAGRITPTSRARLEYLPIGAFGGIMGLTGLSVGWRQAHAVLDTPVAIADGIGVIAVVAFLALTAAYLVKLATAPGAVRAEFDNLIAGNLFGTFFISLLLLPLFLAQYSLPIARALWVLGAVAMIVFAWAIVLRWISRPHEVVHVTPTWIVPAVGLLDLPLALPALQWPDLHPVMVFGLAVGLVFAVPVFTMSLGRLIVGSPMPDALQPTLLMLVAPFAVGFSAYVVTTGNDDTFADALYMLTLFMLAVLVWRLARILPGKAFKLTWWATSFPLAAGAIAGLRYASYHPGPIAFAIGILLLAVASLAIAGLMLRTLIGIARGELRAMS